MPGGNRLHFQKRVKQRLMEVLFKRGMGRSKDKPVGMMRHHKATIRQQWKKLPALFLKGQVEILVNGTQGNLSPWKRGAHRAVT